MNKSAIALAVASALAGTSAMVASAPALADTVLYGSARVSVDYSSGDIFDTFSSSQVREQATWDLVNNSSRLGVRGSEDLGGGLAVIYQYEFGVDTTEGGNFNSNRPRVVGLKHENWGQLSLGTQWTPYYNVVGVSDVFNTGKSFGDGQYLGIFRQDNSVYYQSPSWYGAQFQGMVVVNGTADNPNNRFGNTETGADLYNLSGIYQNGPIFVGATYIKLNGDDPAQVGFVDGDRDNWGAGAGYTWGPLAFTATYEYGDLNNSFGPAGSATEATTTGNNADYYGTLSWTFGSNILRAGGGKTRYTPVAPDSPFWVNNYLVGYQHNLSKRSRLWAEWYRRDPKGTEAQQVFSNNDTVSLGIRHDF